MLVALNVENFSPERRASEERIVADAGEEFFEVPAAGRRS